MSDCNVLVATPKLRWLNKPAGTVWGQPANPQKVLQQYFTDPLDVSGKGEWHDIPIVNENSTEPPILEN